MTAINTDYEQFTDDLFNEIKSDTEHFDFVGSAAENCMFRQKNSDVDVMYTFPGVVAVSKHYDDISPLHSADSKLDVLRISTDGVHSGYANLQRANGEALRHLDILNFEHSDQSTYCRHGPALAVRDNQRLEAKIVFGMMDFVCCVKCPVWPVEASEWVTRRRQHGWPSQELINNIVQQGCHFVAIAHKHSTNPDKEWRFSFSKAEIQLIHSWQETQKEVYRQLRFIVSKVNERFQEDDRILCGYHMKTLMLWACEEKPAEFWEKDNIHSFHATQQLMSEMIQCLRCKKLSSYFIRENNLLDFGNQKILTYLVILLERVSYVPKNDDRSEICDDEYRIGTAAFSLLVCPVLEEDRSLSPVSLVCMSLMSKLKCFREFGKECDAKFSACDVAILRKLLRCDLCDLYRGLKAQLRSQTLSGQEKENCLSAAHRNLLKATETRDRLVKVSSNVNGFNDDFSTLFSASTPTALCKTFSQFGLKVDESSLQELHQQTMSTLIEEIIDEKQPLPSAASNVFPRHRCVPQKELLYSRCSDFVQQHFTVNGEILLCDLFNVDGGGVPMKFRRISWLLSATYLCNFYYMNKEYDTAVTLCDQVITYLLPLNNFHFHHRVFSEQFFHIVLSTRWSGLFDADIQSTLINHRNQQNKENDTGVSEVCLYACPIFFAHYIKLRCLIDTGQDVDTDRKLARDEFLHHFQHCEAKGVTANLQLLTILAYKLTLRRMGLL